MLDPDALAQDIERQYHEATTAEDGNTAVLDQEKLAQDVKRQLATASTAPEQAPDFSDFQVTKDQMLIHTTEANLLQE
jgi:translation initiation factor 1 (eIF-1/SUI1)